MSIRQQQCNNNTDIAGERNMFFINAVTYLNIQENSYTVADFENLSDPVQKAMEKTELHGSILFIKNKEQISQNSFSSSKRHRLMY